MPGYVCMSLPVWHQVYVAVQNLTPYSLQISLVWQHGWQPNTAADKWEDFHRYVCMNVGVIMELTLVWYLMGYVSCILLCDWYMQCHVVPNLTEWPQLHHTSRYPLPGRVILWWWLLKCELYNIYLTTISVPACIVIDWGDFAFRIVFSCYGFINSAPMF